MSLTIKYKNAHIHVSTFRGHEEILIQFKNGELMFAKSVHAAKIIISRRVN